MHEEQIRDLVMKTVDDQFGTVAELPTLLETSFPELFPERGAPPFKQPCNTEFTTSGEANGANKAGVANAVNKARLIASLICQCSPCKTLELVRIERVHRSLRNLITAEVVWKCTNGQKAP